MGQWDTFSKSSEASFFWFLAQAEESKDAEHEAEDEEVPKSCSLNSFKGIV